MRSGSVKWNVAPLPGVALEPHPAAHQRHEARGDRQAEAGAAELPRRSILGLREGVEDRLLLLARDADAGVGDADVQHDVAPSRCSSTPTCTATEPSRVNFTALPIRLVMIWPSRPPSPISRSGSAGDTS